MNSSHRADVIVVQGNMRINSDINVTGTIQAETTNLAPEPARRIIVLAPTKQAGTKHAEALGINPVAIITPRSPHGARGMVADDIIEADGLSAEERDALMIEVAPTLATTQWNA